MNTPHKTPAFEPVRRHWHITQGRASRWWSERTVREQRLLRVTVGVLVSAAFWWLGVQPALTSMEHSKRTLLRLQNEAASLDGLILEAQRLTRARVARLDAEAIQATLVASSQASGLDLTVKPGMTQGSDRPSLQSQVPDGLTSVQWVLELEDVDAAKLMDWLARLPQLVAGNVISMELARSRRDGRDRPGRVTGTIILGTMAEDQP